MRSPKGQQDSEVEQLGVADAKRRFSELMDRITRGERFLIVRRGKPAVALVAPGSIPAAVREEPPVGLAAVAGELAEWEDLEESMTEVVAARRGVGDRRVPGLP